MPERRLFLLTANDDFGGDGPSTSAITITDGPNNGTATVNEKGTLNNPTDDAIDYTPDPGFNGTDSVVYAIADADDDVDTATLTVTVNATGGDAAVYFKASNTAADDRFGGSLDTSALNEDNFGGATVALSADGDTLVVAAPSHATSAGRALRVRARRRWQLEPAGDLPGVECRRHGSFRCVRGVVGRR
ncbi:MAG: Ig-like domain-containing protein [Halofilum sp. (in: g-proteobacteria)]|nr:Ig-like domain-containing protein [Halofilum sp. (in: g-proteobacteria)]